MTTRSIGPARALKRSRHWLGSDEMWGYAFIAPQFLGAVVFIFSPAVFAIALSMFKWDFYNSPLFVGLANFRYVLSDPLTPKVITNTLYFLAINVPATLITATLLALLLNMNIRGLIFFRAAYFFPSITSAVAVALVWMWMYMPDFGLINMVLAELFGVNGPLWLSSPSTAMPAVVMVTIWQWTGYNSVVILAGLKNIPQSYLEAAEIDGANPIQKFFRIKLPMLTPTLFFLSTMLMINGIQVFNEPFMMTEGGPNNATRTMMLHIYNYAFKYFEMGNAAVLSLMLFTMSIAFTALQFTMQRKWVSYDV